MSIRTPSVPKFPPTGDGSFFFQDVIDFHMQNNPTLPMWVYADDRGGITEITFLEFGRAAHRVAHAIRPEPTGVDHGQIVMLIANSDTIHHHVLVAGMSIAGLVPFPVSPRNSAAAVIDMMRKTNCSRIVTLHHAHQSLIDAIRSQGFCLAFTVEEVPTLSYAFPKLGFEAEADPFVPYARPAAPPDPDLPLLYLHSSGSTGFPKPIPHSHKIQIQWMRHLKAAYGRKMSPGYRIGVMGLPPFHCWGMMQQLCLPLACLVTVVVYPPQTIADRRALPIVPTSGNILDSSRRTHCQTLVTVPTFLKHWAASADAVELLAKLDRVICGGGPLAAKIGDALWAAGVNINMAYGTTETGQPIVLRDRAEIEDGEWMWMRFSENFKVRWAPQGDDRYECQILTTENTKVAVENLPDVKGYATSDLFVKHPTKELWNIVGRADDVIILASGEKIVPIQMEGIIVSDSLIQGAVMFGRERNQAGVLVEPGPEHAVDVLDANAVTAFRDKIWPAIEEANRIAPAFGRIFKEMILIVHPELPMIRTPKGTVQRKATINAYEAKIDMLYNDMEASHQFSSGSLSGPFAWTTEGVLDWLTGHANTVGPGRSLDPTLDLFSQGFDSLSAAYLRNQIVRVLHKAPEALVRRSAALVSQNFVFENPTLELLATRIASLVEDRVVFPSSMDYKNQHVTAMNAMIKKYTVGLPGSVAFRATNGTANSIASHPDGAVVLLTGSTGGLGSFLLSKLLENPRVKRVYALNRPSFSATIEERQKSAFIDKDISVDLLSCRKLVYVEAEASLDNCGMPLELYEEIRSSVTVIIHNAWRLDFNLSLASFEPNVRATRNLVDLALNCKHSSSPRFLFTSSIATAQSWDRTKGPVPEKLQMDPSTAVGFGYGESKYVCDRIIAKSGLRSTSLRIGQMVGGPNGSWATTDWAPIIVKSSIALGALPRSEGVVSWMRTEDVAAAVLDVAFAKSAPQTLNIVNPKRRRWSSAISTIRDVILEQNLLPHVDHLEIVPFVEWVARLEIIASSTSLEENSVCVPAVKLLEFYRTIAHEDALAPAHKRNGSRIFEAGGPANFSTTKARRVSVAVSKMRAVDDDRVRAWVQYWISKGLF